MLLPIPSSPDRGLGKGGHLPVPQGLELCWATCVWRGDSEDPHPSSPWTPKPGVQGCWEDLLVSLPPLLDLQQIDLQMNLQNITYL